MAITATDIKDRFPEFGSLSATVVTRWLEEAERNHNACQWSGKSDDALAWLTAHFLAAYGSGCAGSLPGPGPLTSTREGQVSATWSPATVPEIFRKNDLGTTAYGRRYLSMLSTIQTKRCT